MAAVKQKDTKPEMKVRSFLHRHGLRYRLHDNKLSGKPDLVFPRFHTVLFVHGCFWQLYVNVFSASLSASDKVCCTCANGDKSSLAQGLPATAYLVETLSQRGRTGYKSAKIN
jgi:hypothetical protein